MNNHHYFLQLFSSNKILTVTKNRPGNTGCWGFDTPNDFPVRFQLPFYWDEISPDMKLNGYNLCYTSVLNWAIIFLGGRIRLIIFLVQIIEQTLSLSIDNNCYFAKIRPLEKFDASVTKPPEKDMQFHPLLL